MIDKLVLSDEEMANELNEDLARRSNAYCSVSASSITDRDRAISLATVKKVWGLLNEDCEEESHNQLKIAGQIIKMQPAKKLNCHQCRLEILKALEG